MPKTITLHPVTPQLRFMEEIAVTLNRDGLLIFPSDSGYTLGCSVMSPKALKKIYQLKKSSKKYQMSILFPDFAPVSEFAYVDNAAFKYMRPLVPGPYTFILPCTRKGRKLLEVNREEIGVRIPEHVFLTALQNHFPYPIITTSPKNEGEEFKLPEEISPFFLNAADVVADMGEIPMNESTVIRLTGDEPELIREGAGPVP